MIDLNKFNKGESGGDGESGPVELDESLASKVLRETQMVGRGVGGAFLDTANNPIEKAPELALAGGIGVGLKALQKAGAKGQVVAAAVGLGMAGKMAYDEYMGNRWSTFGAALNDNWQSSVNFDRNVIATKESIGALAVDSTVSMIGFKAAGSPVGKRVLNGEMGSKVSLRVSLEAPPHHSWLNGVAESPANPSLIAEIRAAAKGKPGDHGSLFGPHGQSGPSSTSFLHSLDVRASRDPALLQGIREAAAGERLSKVETPPTKSWEARSEIGGASSHAEVPAEGLASLNRFSHEMYHRISARIKGSSGVEDGLLGARSYDGHVNAGLPKSPETKAPLDLSWLEGIEGLRTTSERLSKAEAPVAPLDNSSVITGAPHQLEVPSETLAALNRISNEMYERISNTARNADSSLGTPAADATAGGLPQSNYRWIPPREAVIDFRTSYPTVVEPIQGADAVVSLTSQGTVSSLALSKSLTAPGAAARVRAMVGYAELASTDPAACDAAIASTLLGRVGLAGRTTNATAALRGAEAYVNGARGNSFTTYLVDRYGPL